MACLQRSIIGWNVGLRQLKLQSIEKISLYIKNTKGSPLTSDDGKPSLINIDKSGANKAAILPTRLKIILGLKFGNAII